MALSRGEVSSEIARQGQDMRQEIVGTPPDVLFSRVSPIPFLPPKVFSFNVDESESLRGKPSVISLSWFFPSGRLWKEKLSEAGISDKADIWSNAITSLKGYNGPESQRATILEFRNLILELIIPNTNIIVMAVPSSTVGNPNHGASKLAQAITEQQPSYITCGNSYLIRIESIIPAHESRRRLSDQEMLDTHERTIAVTNPEQIRGKTILLIDDILTKGFSSRVCREKLKNAGASKVVCLTLGRSISSNRHRYADFPIPPLCELDELLAESLASSLRQNAELAKRWYNESLPLHPKMAII